MKVLTFAVCVFTSLSVFAADEKVQDSCDIAVMYQPGTQDPAYAAKILGFEMHSSACNLREVLKLTKKQYLYMRAFDSEARSFRYQIIDFASSEPTKQTCTITSKFKRSTEGHWDSLIEVFAQPTCSEPTLAK
jgi:hypothetical protein